MTGEYPKSLVDHINKNRLDNKWKNLRKATNSQNTWNQKLPKDNTSGYKGVNWNPPHMKWHARIMVNGKSHHLGYYQSSKEAALAYNVAAFKFFGEFASLNKIN